MSERNESIQRDRIAPGAAVLWASALLIFAMILTQASRFGGPSEAHAELVAHIGELVALTANAGNDEDVMLVLDSRSDRLLVYAIQNGETLVLRSSYEVSSLFQQGQAATGRRSR